MARPIESGPAIRKRLAGHRGEPERLVRFRIRRKSTVPGDCRSAGGEAAFAGTGLVGAPAPPVAEQGVELKALPRVEREHVIVRHARRAPRSIGHVRKGKAEAAAGVDHRRRRPVSRGN